MSLVSQIPQLSQREETLKDVSKTSPRHHKRHREKLNETDSRASLRERETAKTPKFKSEIYLKKSYNSDYENDKKPEKWILEK